MQSTLVLVHAIFRHGDRTPDQDHIYPTDPHKDVTYAPFGYGQLTTKGKAKAYKLGNILRLNYDRFLGDVYTPEILDSWSADIDRAKVALQLVLASLFPPKEDQIWNEELPWQPIPYKYVPLAGDNMFLGWVRNPVAVTIYEEYIRGPGKKVFEEHVDILRYLEENTGVKMRTPRDVMMLCGVLATEQTFGLKLPPWTDSVWPVEMLKIAMIEHDNLAATTKLKSHTIGKLLEKIVSDTKLKRSGKSNYKMHLYSAQDITISVLLRCLQVFSPHFPGYCCCLTFEVHKIDDVFGFKIFYRKDLDAKPELLTLPDCEAFCPLDKFVGLVQDVLEETQLII